MKKQINIKFKRVKQTDFFQPSKITFGGNNKRGHPTRARPFSKKCETHVVMKSRLAIGDRSFLRANNRRAIKAIIEQSAKRFYVTLTRNVNVGNHLHLLICAPTAEAQRNFLRTISALIARKVMSAHRNSPMKLKSLGSLRFWDGRPFTRLIPWGRAYQAILNYLSLNSLQAIGFSKKEGRKYLKGLSSGP